MSDTSVRFYKCYHNASHWICQKDSDALNESTLLDKDGGFVINKTLSIPSWIHVATDELILSYKLRGPVSIKHPPYRYTHMSSGVAAEQKEAKSSE
jgi:hypothetical protein